MKVTYEKEIEMYRGLPCCPGYRIVCNIILSLTILRGVILVDKRWIDEACKCIPSGMRGSKYFSTPGFSQNDRLIKKLESPNVSVSVTKTPDRTREVGAGRVVNFARIIVTIKATDDDKDPVTLRINPETEKFA